MRAIDRRAQEEFGIPAANLMENAGRAVAAEALRLLRSKKIPKPWKVLALCGGGNNGGDGFVAARLLAARGARTMTLILKPKEALEGPARSNFQKLMDLNLAYAILPKFDKIKTEIGNARLVLDALLGTGLKKEVQEPFRSAIRALNRSRKTVIAVDVPSGLDADTGGVHGICVKAHRTVTMGALKTGLLVPAARKWTGRVIVADIGFPKNIFK